MIGEFLDATRDETILALRAEVERLQAGQEAERAADDAFASLKQKLNALRVRTPEQG